MWPWMKRWLDWVTTDVLPLSRSRPHGQAVHTRYEKAGLALYDLPVPWNADAVVVEVLLKLPPAARKKGDFTLRLPGREPVPAESLRPEADSRHRLLFRLPVPASTTDGELLWKSKHLSRVSVPVLTVGEFLTGLRLTLPTVAVRLGAQTVAAQTFVASQCRGLTATCVLRGATPLAPVGDLGLTAVFRSERAGTTYEVPVTLSSSQLAAREALLTAACPKVPRRVGRWAVSWVIGGREMCVQRVEAIPARRFEASLRVADTRFVAADKAGAVRVLRQPPATGEAARVGPCFLVASSEPGMAGVCRLQIHAATPGERRPPLLMEQDVLVTDGPTVFAPGLLDAAETPTVGGFELRHKGRVLGSASLRPVPSAALTAEGGFKPPPDFAWTPTADDELAERLSRLMGGGS
ncbi:hypothetical protein [Urbifossiella limnaea]|uniref:Uncharacterized protein n=1 Tax=Urbifossiella limnaea TaxID=2528023 RepID=A0A517XZ57_9BACT|nr:hypothetical protein [Urbifossiella limnaea]QDU22763.1 hypothetical protein ETAA1_47490 [Urbifossiella limnaea]